MPTNVHPWGRRSVRCRRSPRTGRVFLRGRRPSCACRCRRCDGALTGSDGQGSCGSFSVGTGTGTGTGSGSFVGSAGGNRLVVGSGSGTLGSDTVGSGTAGVPCTGSSCWPEGGPGRDLLGGRCAGAPDASADGAGRETAAGVVLTSTVAPGCGRTVPAGTRWRVPPWDVR